VCVISKPKKYVGALGSSRTVAPHKKVYFVEVEKYTSDIVTKYCRQFP